VVLFFILGIIATRLKDIVKEITRSLFSDFAIIVYLSEVQVLRPEKFI